MYDTHFKLKIRSELVEDFDWKIQSRVLKIVKFYKNTNWGSIKSYLPMGDGANKPANAPTAADPNAINPSGMVAAVLMLK